jgi:hypothetical protein
MAEPGAIIRDQPLRDGVAYSRGLLEGLDRQRPTPEAVLRDNASTSVQRVIGIVDELGRRRPSPEVRAIDNASGVINSVTQGLLGIRDKTVTITTQQRMVTVPGSNIRSTVGPKDGGAIEGGRIAPWKKYDIGGAVVGRGSTRDDLIPAYGPEGDPNYRISNGEHVLDGLDVLLMGGQAGVYAFRDALNSGRFGSPGPDTAVRAMAASRAPAQAAPAAAGGLRDVTILTQDNPRAIVRAIRQDEHEQQSLARVW